MRLRVPGLPWGQWSGGLHRGPPKGRGGPCIPGTHQFGSSRAQQHVCSEGSQCLALETGAGSVGRRSGPPRPPSTHLSVPAGPTCQQALDGEQDGAHVVEGRPLVLEDVKADVALGVDVGVVTGCQEPHGGRSVGVSTGELQGQLVPQLLVGLGTGVRGASQGGQAAPGRTEVTLGAGRAGTPCSPCQRRRRWSQSI